MESLTKHLISDKYNTAIKDIAGVEDVSKFYHIFKNFSNSDDTEALLQQFSNIRTERTRTKVVWAVKKSLLQFKGEEHCQLIVAIFSQEKNPDDYRFAFFWHFILCNRLFREISVNVFTKAYYSGRSSISQDDIIPFIKEIKGDDEKPVFSDNTIYRLATKYLSLMTKLGFVTNGRIKSFQHIRPSSEAQVLFLYFAKLFSSNTRNILTNELLPVSFIPSDDVQEQLKILSKKGFFHMNINGVDLNIELIYNYKGICDALYN